jgi:hypothetical protein
LLGALSIVRPHGNFIDDCEEFVPREENFGMQAIQHTGFKKHLSNLREKDVDIRLFTAGSHCG